VKVRRSLRSSCKTAAKILFVTAFCTVVYGQPPRKIHDLKPTVLLISIDGFRADYLDRGVTPNLSSLARDGVRSDWMQPVFPSKTFPNHFTLVTGLYPEQHGIVGNEFWDPERQRQFVFNKEVAGDPAWWQAEPIWLTAERQGLKSATVFWPGSDVPIAGKRPTYWLKYTHELPDDERVQRLLVWLDLPVAQRPQMLTMYFSSVDTAGHNFGPDSSELTAALQRVDTMIGRLLDALKARGIEKQINIIIVSDHGMAPTAPEQAIFIEDYLDLRTLRISTWGALFGAEAPDGNNEPLIDALRKVPHVTVYRKCAMPGRFHYCHNPRISPILLLADEGWNITTRTRLAARATPERGSHGYDHQLPSMRALFIATGAGFKHGQRIPGFANIHVYVLMCHLLGIKPASSEGKLATFQSVLR
jgi:predicted AlkP superfamily pyrophosphatase or phosphodiesterase